MKKSVYKVLSVITALCLLFGICPIYVFATEEELTEVEAVSTIQFSPETELDYESGIFANKFYSVGEQVDTTKYFYNQLTGNQKKIYEQIWTAGPMQSITLDLTGISIIGTGTSSSSKTNAQKTAMNDIMMALTALNEDNPLFFWADGFGISYGGTRKNSGGNYTYTITTLIVNINIDTTNFTDFNDVKAKQTAIIEKLETIKVNGISRHEKLKSIHDYLANNIVYDDTISQPNIFDSYGALISGVCVCEGYAEVFKLLCDREGIPCITVIGTGNGGAHKWNMVQMEDNEWYTVDATWNDQSANVFYSYFLIGSGTKAPFFSNQTVADATVHIPTGKWFSNANVALSYPTLSTDTYGIGILAPNTADIHFDKTRGVLMVGKGLTSYYYNFVDPNVYSLNTDFDTTRNGSGVTTSTLTVTDGVSTKTYLVAMRGDVNASNTTNTTDYTVITKVCAATQKIEKDTAKFYAGDMNQDGAVDGFDAIALELYINGTLTFD